MGCLSRPADIHTDSFRRYTLKPVVLKDGTTIPAGSLIETPNKAVLMDPELYPNPEVWTPG